MNRYDARDIIKDILFFFFAVAGAFLWLMLVLLIISFVTLSYIHMTIEFMMIASVVFAGIIGIVYIVSKVRKYSGK